MTEYLIFRLYAPLASWGEAAVGESRPTATYPRRSAIIGLLGAALGVRRDDDEGQRRLRDSLGIAIKQRSPGSLLRDYHTVQVPASQSRVTYRTRRDELNAPKKVINTILSSRDYRCDGLWTVAVWLMPRAELALEALERALESPYFPLYLGRKACPPGAPLAPRRKTVACLRDALDTDFPPLCGRTTEEEHRALRLPDNSLYAWEGDAERLDGNGRGVESSEAWDDPLHRRRWQFGPRTEYRRMVRAGEER
ncbi:CRISPR-associated Cas5e family protein [Halomonas ventosae]|uniref:CRISPR-associated Cas5e family protein n=1 Tax=Halomonas ventosae TaxID=229007 RepID=A0A4V3DQP5_9GAMM|nr:type I-E CRISPR-associated protein Cas5/CasD [Halomonas ventosae]TDR57006.1 CRISPR-associated Cas5e family protein [Halomonas ventosae]